MNETTTILPLTRNVGTRRSNRNVDLDRISLTIFSILIITLSLTTLYIIHNYNGYGNTNSPVVFSITTAQTFYIICCLPLLLSNKKVLAFSIIPYTICLIFSTRLFVINNQIPFQKTFAILHFINLIANYMIIIYASLLYVYYKLPTNTNVMNPIYIEYNLINVTNNITQDIIVNLNCSICQEKITDISSCHNTICGHKFHKKCIETWVSYRNKVCPNCRTNIVT